MNINSQRPWTTSNVVGHSRDPYTKVIDHTEGFGAFDSIAKSYSLGIRTIDIGGGEHDYNSSYCLHKFGVDQIIYDPFMRDAASNRKVLSIAMSRPLDSCTSISVLNVIDNEHARKEHIQLCHSVVKPCGKVFFKVWPGNGTGIPHLGKENFQSNKDLDAYVDEIFSVFGRKNVRVDNENKIIVCVKNDELGY